jgi:hypothetical protein
MPRVHDSSLYVWVSLGNAMKAKQSKAKLSFKLLVNSKQKESLRSGMHTPIATLNFKLECLTYHHTAPDIHSVVQSSGHLAR